MRYVEHIMKLLSVSNLQAKPCLWQTCVINSRLGLHLIPLPACKTTVSRIDSVEDAPANECTTESSALHAVSKIVVHQPVQRLAILVPLVFPNPSQLVLVQ